MAQKPNEIREHIDAERARLGDDLDEIGSRMKDAVDWRTWYRNNTVAMLGAAVAGGFLLSMAIGRPSSNGRAPSREAEGLLSEESDWRSKSKREGPEVSSRISHHMSRLTDILDNTVGAFLGVASNKLQDYVSRTVPGFKEYYSEEERERAGRL
jgi:hypothetical protein